MNSLGLKTEIMFHRHNGVVTQTPEFMIIATPTNPSYFWGNLLVFPNPPQPGDYEKWLKHFGDVFATRPGVDHQTLAWDLGTPDPGELKKFISQGFEYQETVVLVAKQITPRFENHDYEYRRIVSPQDWAQVIDLQNQTGSDRYKSDEHRAYLEKRYEQYRQLGTKGLGHWYGAFLGDRLVSDLGLYSENGIARYQNIETHPDFRKRGICQNLMKFAALDSESSFFVIHAEEDGPAINMYKSLGFEVKEIIAGVCRFDRQRWSINP